MYELKPCPFCGSEAEVIKTEQTYMAPAMILIRCKYGPCSCQTPVLVYPFADEYSCVANEQPFDREKALVDIWNRRTGEDG